MTLTFTTGSRPLIRQRITIEQARLDMKAQPIGS